MVNRRNNCSLCIPNLFFLSLSTTLSVLHFPPNYETIGDVLRISFRPANFLKVFYFHCQVFGDIKQLYCSFKCRKVVLIYHYCYICVLHYNLNFISRRLTFIICYHQSVGPFDVSHNSIMVGI